MDIRCRRMEYLVYPPTKDLRQRTSILTPTDLTPFARGVSFWESKTGTNSHHFNKYSIVALSDLRCWSYIFSCEASDYSHDSSCQRRKRPGEPLRLRDSEFRPNVAFVGGDGWSTSASANRASTKSIHCHANICTCAAVGSENSPVGLAARCD